MPASACSLPGVDIQGGDLQRAEAAVLPLHMFQRLHGAQVPGLKEAPAVQVDPPAPLHILLFGRVKGHVEGQLNQPKPNTAAQKKKLAKQLEGLDMAERMVDDLLTSGLGALAGASAKTYDKLAKDLGSCYLTGPQTAFTRTGSKATSKDS